MKITTIYDAVNRNDDFTLKNLLEKGANVYERVEGGSTVLMVAIWRASHRVSAELIKHMDTVDQENNIGSTALMYACNELKSRTVKLLIEKGADVNLKDNEGRTAFYFAARSSHKGIINYLLKTCGSKISQDEISNCITLCRKDGSVGAAAFLEDYLLKKAVITNNGHAQISNIEKFNNLEEATINKRMRI